MKYTKTNKDSIITFLKFLFNFIDETKGLLPHEIGIIWDNCSPHRSKEVKSFWIVRRARLFYLPQYSPELATVEIYFSKPKASFIKNVGKQSINLDSDVAIKKLESVIRRIDKKYIISIWSKTYSLIYSLLNSL